MRKTILALGMACLAIFSACEKDENAQQQNGSATDTDSPYKYMYILNEGLWGANDASLDRLVFATGELEKDVFASANSRNLGDVANDMVIYGSKMYILLNQSNTIEVVSPATAKSEKTISLAGKSPRKMVGHDGYLYVSCHSDEIVKIDTATLTVAGSCNVGRDPECMCVIGSTLFVANSGGLDYPNYDTTISIVDLTAFQEVKKARIGLNPSLVAPIGNGKIMVLCNGNYSDIPSSLSVFDISDESVTKLNYQTSKFFIMGNTAYCYDFDWGTYQAVFFKINLNTFEKESLTLNGSSSIASPYEISVNPSNGDIYVTDSQNSSSNGDILCFSKEGKLKWKKECGSVPSKVVLH